MTIINARALCKKIGMFTVGINSRPKVPGGGWEVYVKDKSGQRWSKNSNAFAGDLRECVHKANEVAQQLDENMNKDGDKEGDDHAEGDKDGDKDDNKEGDKEGDKEKQGDEELADFGGDAEDTD
eukprot:9480144-Pyramimonas_sp.AAC.1